LNCGLSTDFSVQLQLSLSKKTRRKSKSKSEVTHCVSKNNQNCFHHKFVKFQTTLIIVGIDMAKTIELCKVYPFSTSHNLRQCTTVWNTDTSNCYITWWLFISDCSPLHHQFDRRYYEI